MKANIKQQQSHYHIVYWSFSSSADGSEYIAKFEFECDDVEVVAVVVFIGEETFEFDWEFETFIFELFEDFICLDCSSESESL